jgi:tRNA pseudouridine13 synthase
MLDAGTLRGMVFGDCSIALNDLPSWHGVSCFSGTYREGLEAFQVFEDLGYMPDGTGTHTWVLIEKRGISTDQAAERLAACAAVAQKDVGYAGKKDTVAVVRQWMSVLTKSMLSVGTIDKCCSIVSVTRNSRKLKVGQLAGNRFRLRLSGQASDILEVRMACIADQGFPNYFGLQRFGRKGQNLDAAKRLAVRDPRGKRRLHPKDAMAASAARSAGFNAIVADRIVRGALLDAGVDDAVILTGRGSHFQIRADELASVTTRIGVGELSPTAPLMGSCSKTGERQAEIESRVLEQDPLLYRWLSGIFREEERRSVRVVPKELEWSRSGTTLELSFWLPRGSFATALLHEIGQLTESNERTIA